MTDDPVFDGWIVSHFQDAQVEYEFVKSFSDGTYVEIAIVKEGNDYQVKSSAESRTSGPAEAVLGKFEALQDALSLAHQTRREWNDEFDG